MRISSSVAGRENMLDVRETNSLDSKECRSQAGGEWMWRSSIQTELDRNNLKPF